MKITLNLFLFAQPFCVGFLLLRRVKLFYEVTLQIDLCKLYILFATGFGGKRLRPFKQKIKY